MVVKSIRGRRRYIAFRVNSSFRKTGLASELRFCGSRAPYVIQCSDGWAIMECRPDEVEKTILLTKEVDPSSVPLLTSGTILSLRKKYPNLRKSHNQ